ncbi:N-acetyltransferase [Dokdonia sinensis]|uniref:N-acetyltransferase n=1 Tax=Dokdonia sinensis TaxID=2479847 RepID=A0A3M0G5T6_9FLAO|nr:GNAT family N-acetyltransferase [Dokdonia sinensis]RMB57632.1 N-acetyltransferase [Dokdonia sinensis]
MGSICLKSERLTLRLIIGSDLYNIHNLHSCPEVDAYNTLGIPKDIDETKAIIEPWIVENEQEIIKNYVFAIERTEDALFLGLFGLKLNHPKTKRGEIWYKIHPDFWGKGYATESTNLVLDYAFDKLELHRLEAGCAVENTGSIKVLEKVGMTQEGRCRKILPLKSGWSDNFQYAILETDKRM